MSLLYEDYKSDIESALSSVEFISNWDSITRIKEEELKLLEGSETFSIIKTIKENYTSFKIDQNIIRGGVILYSVGRFEIFIKQLVEDICERYISKIGEYAKLPKKLKDNLIIYTGIVIQEPRKYGHGENGVESFIRTMNKNIENTLPFDKVNTECITITDSNMRPDIIIELFDRIGANKVLDKVAAQASIQSYLATDSIEKALKDIKTKINITMDLRNSIAHPAPSFTWPSKEDIQEKIKFMLVLGKALDDVSDVYVSALT